MTSITSITKRIQIEADVKVVEVPNLPGYSKIILSNKGLEDELTVIVRSNMVEETLTNLDVTISASFKGMLLGARELQKIVEEFGA